MAQGPSIWLWVGDATTPTTKFYVVSAPLRWMLVALAVIILAIG